MGHLNLQVGNYVKYKDDIIEVEAVHSKKVGYHIYSHKLTWVRYSLIKPIKLTKEILDRNFQINEFETNNHKDLFGGITLIFYIMKVPATGFVKEWNLIWNPQEELLIIEDDPTIKIKYFHEL